MLSKLLKYDIASVLKYWWIGAAVSGGLSVMAGLCIFTLENPTADDLMKFVASIGVYFAVVGMSAFSLFGTVLVFIRYFKNFFTDEGYLTFTLPVKRSQLLLSKFITSMLVNVATIIVFIVDVMVLFCVGEWQNNPIERLTKFLVQEFGDIFDSAYNFIITLEAIIAILAAIAVFCIFMFFCITFGSTITRRAKVITSIGIFYGASSVTSIFAQVVLIFSIYCLEDWMGSLKGEILDIAGVILFLMIILFFAAIASLLYNFVLMMLERRLNLK